MTATLCNFCGHSLTHLNHDGCSLAGEAAAERAGNGCTCFVVPDPWTYYGATEPGGALEPDPECPVHFPPGTWERVAEEALAPSGRCPDHETSLPCSGCAGNHLAGEHPNRDHAPTCARCAAPTPTVPQAQPDAMSLAAGDDTLIDTPGENR